MDLKKQENYSIVMGTTPRISLGLFISYLFGKFSNSIVLSRLKVKTERKNLLLRTILSTIVGQVLDSIIFIAISLY